jgi:perosamine synthetase
MIPVFKPSFGDEELEALREPFASGWIGLGPRTAEFEERFAHFIGCESAVATSSCTGALHLALRLCEVEDREVLTTSMTFVSTNHAILYNGAVPVFVDIEEDTLNVQVEDLKQKLTDRTGAIVVVHYGGHAVDMDPILEVAREHGLPVVEDCAHACGGSYKGRMLGSLGDFGAFSFHAVKNLATGDGGMITTKDRDSADHLRRLAWMGISRGTWDRSEGSGYSWEYDVPELGFKYHMNDITAAIGLVQLAKLDAMNARRRELAGRYTQKLAGVIDVQTPVERTYARSACHNYVIKVSDPEDRDPLMDSLRMRGICTGMHYIPNHLYDMYRPYVTGPLPVTEEVWKRLVTLPLFPDLTYEEQDSIVVAIEDYFRSRG